MCFRMRCTCFLPFSHPFAFLDDVDDVDDDADDGDKKCKTTTTHYSNMQKKRRKIAPRT